MLAELAFARRLPDAEDLIEEAISQLINDEEVWSHEVWVERQLEGLETAGAPKWLVTFLRKREAKKAEEKRIRDTLKT